MASTHLLTRSSMVIDPAYLRLRMMFWAAVYQGEGVSVRNLDDLGGVAFDTKDGRGYERGAVYERGDPRAVYHPATKRAARGSERD